MIVETFVANIKLNSHVFPNKQSVHEMSQLNKYYAESWIQSRLTKAFKDQFDLQNINLTQ